MQRAQPIGIIGDERSAAALRALASSATDGRVVRRQVGCDDADWHQLGE